MIAKTKSRNFLTLLKQKKEQYPDKVIYRVLDRAGAETTLTYTQLDTIALSIADAILETCVPRDRVILFYNSSIDFLTAFFGCFYAGVIAVPAYAPSKNQKLSRIEAIIANAEVKLVLTTPDIAQLLSINNQETSHLLDNMPILLTTEIPFESRQANVLPTINDSDIAFLQYTSGSTGTPKGVIITHENMMENQLVIHKFSGGNMNSRMVTWLPHFHDMGLIGGLLHPLYIGFEAVVLSPIDFLREPAKWLRAISPCPLV